MTENPSVPDNGPDDEQQQKQQQSREPRPHVEHGPTFAAGEPPAYDLSDEIVRAVKRVAGERVTCRRIAGNNYRCNWWSAHSTNGYDNPNMTGQTVMTHRVSRSALLRVTKTRDGTLLMETVTGTPR